MPLRLPGVYHLFEVDSKGTVTQTVRKLDICLWENVPEAFYSVDVINVNLKECRDFRVPFDVRLAVVAVWLHLHGPG